MRPFFAALLVWACAVGCGAAPEPSPLPVILSGTGLFVPGSAPGDELAVASGVRSFTPQYPL